MIKPAASAQKSLFLFAGELSGDCLGGALMQALPKHHRLFGVGGPEMRAAGLSCFLSMEQFQVMGFTDVFKALPRLFRHFRTIKNTILSEQPQGVILIDYPEFNMLLACSLRKSGYRGKIIHYVCPSIWAWRKKRIKPLSKNLDLLLSILPFEKELFHKTNLSVAYVGHPLVAAIDRYIPDPEWIPPGSCILALFPGSRRHEIALNLPLQLKAAALLRRSHPELTLAISVARPELHDAIQNQLRQSGISATLVPGAHRYELMRSCHLALATSGTVTLELALHATPTVVTYQLAPLNYFLGRYAFRIRLPHYCLVNIIYGRTLFPEFIHRELDPQEIKEALTYCLTHHETIREGCYTLRRKLTQEDASQKAAEAIEALL